MNILVRRGTRGDAPAAVETLRRSISDLCEIDYQDDPHRLAQWLRNKTEASWMAWIDRDDATVLVADRAGKLASVGMVDHLGNILLNCVHPEARFCGVSKAMLASLEDVARGHHAERCRLETTRTARAFYERCGYVPLKGSTAHLSKSL
ncbi:GNAT family N-acetyltransferase [Pseudotabrizicola sp. 4114]|uniref:GNAT family N-acetyltransferase n=1 Tax=Pseudotabrizicola sp. 4114 TaxID=2817731 RepID=UPI0028656DCB|nr:GNAT superfamily N-acetyltransferase [Pseudorhodobacter sp. 4114]